MSTIKDVAKYAGVSTATVSHVLNDTKPVLPATRERIMDAIRVLNYIPNPTAKSFKTGKKYSVAFIVPDISNNYFAGIIKALEARLRQDNYHLILVNTNENTEHEIQHLKYITSGIADGLVLATTAENYTLIQKHIPSDFPVVLVDRKFEDCPYDTITSSDQNAVFDGMEYLVQKGHHKIGYIGDLPHLSTAKDRLWSYQEACKKLNLPLSPEQIATATSLSHDAYEKAGQLLVSGCTALVMGNNTMTIDAYSYALTHWDQYSRVSILGYRHRDLPPVFYKNAGVITLNEDIIGTTAAEQILTRIENPKAPRREITISNQYCPPSQL